MQPWIFTPNALIDIWSPQVGLPGGAPTYPFILMQYMKPYYPWAQNVKGIAIHRFIIEIASSQIWTSTDVLNGIVVSPTDQANNNLGYFDVIDFSSFFYDDGTGNKLCDLQMFVCRISQF